MGSSVILPTPGQPVMGPDPSFKSAAVPNIVTFGLTRLSPPSNVYVQRDDILAVTFASTLATEVVTINIRLLLPSAPLPGQPDHHGDLTPSDAPVGGQNIVTIQQTVTVGASTRTELFSTFNLAEGYLLSVTATPALAATRGQTYVRVQLGRRVTPVSPVPVFYQLFGDYITFAQSGGWPVGRVLSPLEGPGQLHSIQQANPAAGADWTFTTAANQRLQVRSFSATFTASAAAANRNINIILDDGANVLWQDDVSVAVTTGQTVSVNGAPTNVPVGVITTELFVVIPADLRLAIGWRLRSATGNIQAGDQWTSIWFNTEEWLDVQ